MGRLDESLPRYERAIAAGSHPGNRALNAYFYNHGLALFRLGRYQDAIRQFQASLRLYGTDPMPHFLLGRSLAALQQFPEAIAAMETAVKLAPDFASAQYVLAQLLHTHGDKQRAAALFHKVAQLNKRDLEQSMQAPMRMKTASPDKALGTADLR
jgi:tetratricopeptide (TPR) repeat protein